MKFLLFMVVAVFVGCSSDHYETKAVIEERKMLPDGQLMIRYFFKVGNEIIHDSVRTKNKVIAHDSLKVVYSLSDPGKNTLRFE